MVLYIYSDLSLNARVTKLEILAVFYSVDDRKSARFSISPALENSINRSMCSVLW